MTALLVWQLFTVDLIENQLLVKLFVELIKQKLCGTDQKKLFANQ